MSSYPKIVHKKRKVYKLIKKYKHYALYEEERTKFKICFDKFDLGLQKEMIKPPSYINTDNVKI